MSTVDSRASLEPLRRRSEAPALHEEAALVGVARDHVLDGARQDVAIVRQAGGEGWAVIEVVCRPKEA